MKLTKNKKGIVGIFLNPMFWLIIGSLYFVLFSITFLAHLRINSYANERCQKTQPNLNPPIYDDGIYSVICGYDKEGNFIQQQRGFGRALVSPLNLLSGNTCAVGLGSQSRLRLDSSSRCSIIPLWVDLA